MIKTEMSNDGNPVMHSHTRTNDHTMPLRPHEWNASMMEITEEVLIVLSYHRLIIVR